MFHSFLAGLQKILRAITLKLQAYEFFARNDRLLILNDLGEGSHVQRKYKTARNSLISLPSYTF